MKKDVVSGVGKNIRQTNIQNQRLALCDAGVSSVGIKAIRKVGLAPVFNMEVEENHNFAIEDGLIVHNCMDSMRYFVKTMRVAVEKTPYKPLWNR